MKGLLDPPFNQSISQRTQKTIGRLAISPGMSILDAGCGPKRLTLPIAKTTGPQGEVTATDILGRHAARGAETDP